MTEHCVHTADNCALLLDYFQTVRLLGLLYANCTHNEKCKIGQFSFLLLLM